MKRVVLGGRVGKNAVTKQVGQGTVTEFTVATGRKNEEPEWHNVSIWGKRGQALEPYLTAGANVVVDGQLKTSVYTTQQGKVGVDNSVKADDIHLAGGQVQGGQPVQQPVATGQPLQFGGLAYQNQQVPNQGVNVQPGNQVPGQQPTFTTDDIPF